MAIDYIPHTLKQVDPDRYFISLFAPADRRRALWVLFLFNHEISKTRFTVTETQLGLIRLQWWREEIGKLYMGAAAPDNPVLKGLEAAIRDFVLPQMLFDNLVYAHEFDLEDVPPTGFKGLESYVDLTTTPLNKLALQITGDEMDEKIIQSVSIRYGLLKLFLGRPYYQAHNFILIEDKSVDNVRNILVQKVDRVRGSSILRAQQALCEVYISQLKKCDFNPIVDNMKKPPLFKELRVWFGVVF